MPKPPGKGAHLAVLVALCGCFVCLMASTLIQPLAPWPSEPNAAAPPTATSTTPPTITPVPSSTPPPEPTRTSPPTSRLANTPYPTDTPQSSSTPYPTSTPRPIATATLRPSDTPRPSATPRPPTPTWTPWPPSPTPLPPTPTVPPPLPTFEIIGGIIPLCTTYSAAAQLAVPPTLVVVGRTSTFTATLQNTGCAPLDSLTYYLIVNTDAPPPVLTPVPVPPIVHGGTLTRNQSNTEVFAVAGAGAGKCYVRAAVTYVAQTAYGRYSGTAYSDWTTVYVMQPLY